MLLRGRRYRPRVCQFICSAHHSSRDRSYWPSPQPWELWAQSAVLEPASVQSSLTAEGETMNRVILFAIVTLGGLFLILFANNTVAIVAASTITVSAAGGTLWALRTYKRSDALQSGSSQTNKRGVRVQIAALIGVAVAGMGLLFASRSTSQTIFASVLITCGVVGALAARYTSKHLK